MAVREGGAFEHEGFNLHAKVRIASDDDLGRERLCRYGARPPFGPPRPSGRRSAAGPRSRSDDTRRRRTRRRVRVESEPCQPPGLSGVVRHLDVINRSTFPLWLRFVLRAIRQLRSLRLLVGPGALLLLLADRTTNEEDRSRRHDGELPFVPPDVDEMRPLLWSSRIVLAVRQLRGWRWRSTPGSSRERNQPRNTVSIRSHRTALRSGDRRDRRRRRFGRLYGVCCARSGVARSPDPDAAARAPRVATRAWIVSQDTKRATCVC